MGGELHDLRAAFNGVTLQLEVARMALQRGDQTAAALAIDAAQAAAELTARAIHAVSAAWRTETAP